MQPQNAPYPPLQAAINYSNGTPSAILPEGLSVGTPVLGLDGQWYAVTSEKHPPPPVHNLPPNHHPPTINHASHNQAPPDPSPHLGPGSSQPQQEPGWHHRPPVPGQQRYYPLQPAQPIGPPVQHQVQEHMQRHMRQHISLHARPMQFVAYGPPLGNPPPLALALYPTLPARDFVPSQVPPTQATPRGPSRTQSSGDIDSRPETTDARALSLPRRKSLPYPTAAMRQEPPVRGARNLSMSPVNRMVQRPATMSSVEQMIQQPVPSATPHARQPESKPNARQAPTATEGSAAHSAPMTRLSPKPAPAPVPVSDAGVPDLSVVATGSTPPMSCAETQELLRFLGAPTQDDSVASATHLELNKQRSALNDMNNWTDVNAAAAQPAPLDPSRHVTAARACTGADESGAAMQAQADPPVTDPPKPHTSVSSAPLASPPAPPIKQQENAVTLNMQHGPLPPNSNYFTMPKHNPDSDTLIAQPPPNVVPGPLMPRPPPSHAAAPEPLHFPSRAPAPRPVMRVPTLRPGETQRLPPQSYIPNATVPVVAPTYGGPQMTHNRDPCAALLARLASVRTILQKDAALPDDHSALSRDQKQFVAGRFATLAVLEAEADDRPGGQWRWDHLRVIEEELVAVAHEVGLMTYN